ncbi:MAG TPA: bifunctional acetate--CoA ligase family protein/GNAT family N-acetyltransferase [Tepidisphaeraceae bacterium]|nr:bifunctional acetate--CoA ligase family protein/GNAT family N-acetyltransferase [Tepidisphaeraceae bacterium]
MPETPSTSEVTPQNPRHHSTRPLDAIFAPRSIAVIGATETAGSVGRTVLWNLVTSPFGGTVFPVNLKRPSILGIKAYPDIKAVPERVDLAVVVTPAASVPQVIGQCADAGVRAAIVISAGFRELGQAGLALEHRVLEQARRGGMRIIGPNCLGVMNPLTGLNATFAKGIANPGNVAFLSQSGALLTAILDWSLTEMVGFSAFVSTGSMLDVNWGDLIDYFGDDPRTRSILIYMESIGDARAFLSAAREVSLSKPIIVIKAGRSDAAAKAAASHTGSLTGSDEVLDAAFRRCGVLRVDHIAELFSMADVLAKQPRPAGRRLAIVTNAGGPGVLATDALLASGGELAPLSPQVQQTLDAFLPPQWSHNNPIDVLGDAPPDRVAKAIKTIAADSDNDAVLAILTPQDMTDPTQTAEAVKALAKLDGKPLLASWMGGADVAAGHAILTRAGIPTFRFPDAAARAFTYMWRYSYNLRSLYETPALAENDEKEIDRATAARIIATAKSAGKQLLDESQSKKLLAAYGIPIVQTVTATTAIEAARAAETIGFPVALKLFSHTITHKTDVGGVKLNLATLDEVSRAFNEIRESVTRIAGGEHFQGVTVQPMIDARAGYELIVGSSPDSQFGPVLLFGSGGQLVEVLKDRALGLPPLNATLARRMMEQTRIFRALQGVRGRKPVDINLLSQILVRFSQLVVEQPWVKEIEINPLIATSDRIIAVDARAVLWNADKNASDLPRPAVRPYPTQYVTPWSLPDGTAITIRPIRPEDEPLLVRFHQELSDRSVMLRYLHPIRLSQRVAHERLIRVCFNDYDRELALVAEGHHPENGERFILGIGRLSKEPGGNEAEFAILISDAWQNRGLGTQLLKLLLRAANNERLERIFATIMGENLEMQHVAEKLGFTLSRSLTDSTVFAELNLAQHG